MGKFGWSLPAGCSRLPGEDDDWDDTRCCRCNRDIEQVRDALSDDEYEKSPMFNGFCCWACARDYTENQIAMAARQPSGVRGVHSVTFRELLDYRDRAGGEPAPDILAEDPAEYDVQGNPPLTPAEEDVAIDEQLRQRNGCDYCRGHGLIQGVFDVDSVQPCPKCAAVPAATGRLEPKGE